MIKNTIRGRRATGTRRGGSRAVAALLLLGGFALGDGILPMSVAEAQRNPQNRGGKGGGGKGGGKKAPKASLKMSTCGCKSSIDQPRCERRTHWLLSSSTTTPTLTDPFLEPFSFQVSVTEGATSDFLTGTGQLLLTNSGAGHALLSSVAILLEYKTPGGGNAPGPSGGNWSVIDSAMATESALCEAAGFAPTCYGDVVQSTTAELVLMAPDSNDIIALSDIMLVPPSLDNDNDGRFNEDPALLNGGCPEIDNDGDGLYDEDPIAGIDNDGDGAIDEDPIAGIDNDNDGAIDEDPVDGIDNDLDGLIDEDDPDDDGDGLVNEDDPDDDGDGLVDEDDPDDDGDGLVDEDGICEDGTVINFSYEFDVTGLGLEGPGDGIVPSPDDLRINVISTFVGSGKRGSSGASCTVDANCNGVIDGDDGGTPDVNESENNNVRSIQTRLEFDPVACDTTCDSVLLTDQGAFAGDPNCVGVTTDTLNELIFATGVDGTTHDFDVTGTVTCVQTNPCSTLVHDQVTLVGTGCEGVIDSSPAGSAFMVVCENALPVSIRPGDFCTLTQNRWGSAQAIPFLATNFATVFPSGLIVGDPDGPDGDSEYAILLTVAPGVGRILPSFGLPGPLTADLTNPFSSAAGQFAGQLITAKLNVDFDAAGIQPLANMQTFPPGTLGQLVFEAGVAPALIGMSVNEVMALSHVAISGAGTPAGITIVDLARALQFLNLEFQNCVNTAGNLGFPF